MKSIISGLTGLLLAIATAASTAQAEPVFIASASPYQLGDVLAGGKPAYELEVTADLEFPNTIADAMPAFVFMHGSVGPLARHQRYLELARELGFVTLQIDSFGPRGVSSTVGNQTNVTAAMMAIDVLRALDFLAARPDIDPNRIVIMGSSKGAIAAMLAAWDPVRKTVVGDLDFAGYALLYPLCVDIEDARMTDSPVHIFIGEEDNWTPAAPCLKLVEKLNGLGHDWAVTLYEGAYHAFDRSAKGIRTLPHAYSMTGCSIALRADGYEYETNTGYLLNRAERRKALGSCARKGDVKIGGNHAAGALLTDIRAFLESVLQTN